MTLKHWNAAKLGFGVLRRGVFLALFTIAAAFSAAAQSPVTCSLSVSPPAGVAPVTVAASGGCSDSANPITTETLDWGDGTVVAVAPGSFSGLSHTYSAAGNYTVTVSAIDSLGSTGSASQVETITTSSPPSCTLSVSPSSGNVPLAVTATGSCTDPANDITSTSINWGDGSSSPGVTSGTHTYNAAGTYTVTLTATDAGGSSGSATQTVTASQANRPPTCTLQVNPGGGQAPLTVTATGSCTDPDNNIASTVLNWGDGTSSPGVTSGTHTYTTAGTFTITLTATDTGGLSGSASKSINVTSKNVPPTCVLSVAPNSGAAPLNVNANGSCSDPENDIIRTVLNWGDGTSTAATSGSHTYTIVGTYHLSLTATDSAGGIGTAIQTVVVGSGTNAPPHCAMSLSATSGQVPLAITVTPNCTDPENDISTITVSFGDGFYYNAFGAPNASHTYTHSGSFTATVVASDKVGNVSNVASAGVGVTDSPSVFAGGSGQVKQFDIGGKPLKTLNTSQSGAITGMAFDWLTSLYVTDFDADAITKFNGDGNLAGNFGSGFNCKPESAVFDNSGNLYVGQTGCSKALLRFDAYGNLAGAYAVSTEVEGSDWIDLAADQCTIFYTSQGTTVFRFNACSSQQLAPFATSLTTGLAVKILPDSSVLVADQKDIVHFDSGGRVIGKVTAPGENCWVSLALDPDGKSFWAVDYCTSDVMKFDISSGGQLVKFNSGIAAKTAYGLGMRLPGVLPVAAGPLIASNQNLTVSAGQSAAFGLAFTPVGQAQNQTFTFSCANLPVGAECSFSPQTAKVTAAGLTVNVTITTSSGSALAAALTGNWLVCSTLLPGLLLVRRRPASRRKKSRWIGIIALLSCTLLMVACSASGGSKGSSQGGGSLPSVSSTTPASNYAVVVRATSGSMQSSTVVNLNVQ